MKKTKRSKVRKKKVIKKVRRRSRQKQAPVVVQPTIATPPKIPEILITGGAGFIGSHFVDYILTRTNWKVTLLERLSFSGNLNRIAELTSYQNNAGRLRVIYHDLRGVIHDQLTKEIGSPDYIVHFAASTHVDRAITDPLPFYYDNVIGTSNLIEFAKKLPGLKLMVNFSTDEVFGPAPDGYSHKEGDPFNPSNDYAASKVGQEMVARAAFVTHKFKVINTHTLNNFGERQHPEKFLPKTIKSIIEGKPMPIYATVENGVVKEAGIRFWIHASNTADAVYFLLQNGVPGEDYNIIGFDEYDILTLANKVSEIIGKPLIAEYKGFYNARPGHDRRYALDGTKMRTLGWNPPMNFDIALRRTVEFTIKNPRWL